MAKRLPLTIDGQDFSAHINRYSYGVEYIPRDGGRGGMMQDGSMTTDILAWKAVYTMGLNDLTGDRLASMQAACAKSYVEATVYDPLTNASRTATFIPTLSGSSAKLFAGDVVWFGGGVLTLTEK